MQIIDTHCHYNLDPLLQNWKEHWSEAQRAGVVGSIVVGTDRDSSLQACNIAAQSPRLLAAVGIHPSEAVLVNEAVTQLTVLELVKECSKLTKPVAIGETGLDYYHLDRSDKLFQQYCIKQQQSLTAHLEAAAELSVPVLIHVRDTTEQAYKDVLQLLEPFKHLTLILHCFSGPEWYLQKALELGCYISFAANCTYPNAQLLRDHIAKVPADKLLVETDAPFLPPQSHRGSTCYPKYIAETVSFLQQELHIDPEQLVTNARRIFTTIPSL